MNLEKEIKTLKYTRWVEIIVLGIAIYFARRTGVKEAKDYTDYKVETVYEQHASEVTKLFKDHAKNDSAFQTVVLFKLDTLLSK